MEHLPLKAEGTEGFQLVEAHIGRGDLHHGVVLQHVGEHRLSLLAIQQAVEHGEDVGIAGHVGLLLSTLCVVHQCALVLVPERRDDQLAETFGGIAVLLCVLLTAHQRGTLLHGLQGAQVDQLLEGQLAILRHPIGRPVDKHPVAPLAFHHAAAVQSALGVVHQRLHAWVNLADKAGIARVEVVVVDGVEPEESVVQDGVDMLLHGVFATQRPDGAAHHGRVEEGVVVHQVRLDGIAAPHPAVALDALYHHLAVGQVQRVGPHLPDVVDECVAALERAAPLHVLHLREQRHAADADVTLALHQCIAHGAAANQPIVLALPLADGHRGEVNDAVGRKHHLVYQV